MQARKKLLLDEWQAAWEWGEDEDDEGISIANLVHSMRRNKRLELLQFRITVFDRFAAAAAEEREAISHSVYENRLARGQDDFGFVQIAPLCHALQHSSSSHQDNIETLARAVDLQCNDDQRLLWFALCQFPHSYLRSAKLLAVRILPRFISGDTHKFQLALEQYLTILLEDLESSTCKITCAQFASKYKASPLQRIECGVFWARLLLGNAYFTELLEATCDLKVLERERAVLC